jgi:hypothetical protein
MNTQNKFEIFVPSSRTFLVYCNGKEVSNWRELQKEAQKAAIPQIGERWSAYWQDTVEYGVKLLADPSGYVPLDALMRAPIWPDMYYECPEELAAKAVL